MVPGCLETPADERQEFQALAVGMIGDALSGRRASLQQAVRDEDAKVHDVEASRAALEQKVSEAEDLLAASAELVEERRRALSTASQEVLATKTALNEAQEVRRQGDAAMLTVSKDKEAVEVALEENFRPLKDGTWETAQAKAHIGALVPLVKRINLEMSLVTALPSSCTKPPSERGPFDQMVVDKLEELLLAKVKEFADKLEAAGPEFANRAAALEAAQKAADDTRERQTQAAAAVVEAQGAYQEKVAAVNEAKAALLASEPTYKATTKARDEKQAVLEAFETSSLKCFEFLRDRPAKKAPRLGASPLDVQEAAPEAAAAADKPEGAE